MESLPTPVIFNESSLDESSYLKLKKLRNKLIIIRKNKENKNIATSRSWVFEISIKILSEH